MRPIFIHFKIADILNILCPISQKRIAESKAKGWGGGLAHIWLIIVVGQGTGGGLEKEGKVREWEARLWGLKS